MINSVLCAVDISNVGDDSDVLKIAGRLAALDGAQLDIVTVIPNYGTSFVGSFFEDGYHEKIIEAGKEKLSQLVIDTLGDDQNKKTRHIVGSGKAYEEIINVANKAKSDLIVIGAHKSDIKDYLLGPNAARVVRHSNCSVYVVR